MSGLRLDHPEVERAGTYSGPVVKPGNSAGSRLIQVVSGEGKGENASGGTWQRRYWRGYWCGRGDLNPHALAGAATSRLCVCQFRHFRLLRTTWD
jgi:hypothetical protein